MYFQTTMHETLTVENAGDAARRIKADERRDFDACVWTAHGRRLAVVADNHCNNPWLEVAVIDLDRGLQLESITAGWCDEEQLRRYFETCETDDFVFRRNVRLLLDRENGDMRASFECGCCGTDFQSTYAEQRRFDQENGYGICPKCERYYS
jgi:hypothetical protein